MTILLSDVVSKTESNNHDDAMRFEPGIFARILPQPKILMHASNEPMSHDTSRVLGSMSFGRFQIMGYNLWDRCKYQGTLKDYFNNVDDCQIKSFLAFISPRYKDDNFEVYHSNMPLLDEFSKFYNGSIMYAHSLIASYQALQK